MDTLNQARIAKRYAMKELYDKRDFRRFIFESVKDKLFFLNDDDTRWCASFLYGEGFEIFWVMTDLGNDQNEPGAIAKTVEFINELICFLESLNPYTTDTLR